MTNSNPHAYMTSRDFLEMAIAFEHDSALLYRSMQQDMEGSFRQLLELLEKQELNHERTLRAFSAPEPDAIIQFPPDLAKAMPPRPEGTMTLRALIDYAIERERRSRDTYHAAAHSVTGAFRELVQGLARFEEEHEDKLKSMRSI